LRREVNGHSYAITRSSGKGCSPRLALRAVPETEDTAATRRARLNFIVITAVGSGGIIFVEHCSLLF
jgi:hypothetical protein